MPGIWVKLCGITTVEDALSAAEAGADAIGLNFVPGSPRCIDAPAARAIVEAVAGRVTPVGVVADLGAADARRLREQSGVAWLQLHGGEPPELLAALLPEAFKAVRIATEQDVAAAAAYGGDRLLVDAKVPGVLGGSGQSFDWRLVGKLARERRLVLAGGLGPDNVADAVRSVRPWGVDTASGVELAGNPRRKDAARMRAFVRAARGALA